MNKIATLLLSVAIVAIAPVAGHAQSRVYIPPKETKSQLGYRDISGLNWRTIAEHYAPAKGISDWRKAIPARHWKEGYSAYQIAHAWEDANPNLPPEIAALFYGPVELLAAIPEHKTPLPGGRRASETDILAFVRLKSWVCAVAVEGKRDEIFGEPISDWLIDASAGKQTRLKYITDKLGLSHPPPDHIRYQLLHRAAAAIIEAERFNADCAAMIVQSFSPEHAGFEDFAEFMKLFGIDSVKRDEIYKTDMPGMTLYFGWASPAGTVATAPVPGKPERATSTTDAVETAASSTDPIAPTPSPQPSRMPLIALIIGGVIAFALVGGVVFLARRRSRANTEVADESDTASATDADEDDSVGAGKVFENYVEGLLCGRANVKLMKPTNKYDYPDFEMEIRSENITISLECKWRGDFYNGKFDIVRPQQLEDYKTYQQDRGQPFFIVLGVGGTEEKPHYLYTIPLGELPQTKLDLEQLSDFIQKRTDGLCSYDPNTNRLTISR